MPSPTHAPTSVSCTVQAPWSVELIVTGGFAGVERKVEVDSSGAYQAKDLQTGASSEGTLSAEAVAQIQADLPAVCQAAEAGRPPACADCFQYLLGVRFASADYRIGFNDLSLPNNPAAPLVGDLTHVLNEALAP
jgi:hypothetical protein